MWRGIAGLLCSLGLVSWIAGSGVASPRLGASELSAMYGGAYCEYALVVPNDCEKCTSDGNGRYVKCSQAATATLCTPYVNPNPH
jgi:hypothetical protein